MACYSPKGHCDQVGCEVAGICPWIRPKTPGKHGSTDSWPTKAELHADVGALWRGPFGDDYNQRNQGKVGNNIVLFASILARAHGIRSVLELGCGTGQNLAALRTIDPGIELWGVEINEQAAACALEFACRNIVKTSILAFMPPLVPSRDEPPPQGTGAPIQRTWDLVFTKGVLIHTPPEELTQVYDHIHAWTSRYILLAEYYNPTPIEVLYRGHTGTLWKRDYAGEMLDRFADLKLVDHGFAYHRQPYPQDDITWMLLEKC